MSTTNETTTTSLTLTQRRASWIQALRSQKFVQGHDALIQPGPAHCCIGVGREVSEPGWTQSVGPINSEYNPDRDYDKVAEYYGYTSKVTQYLIGMNDGMFVYKDRIGMSDYSTVTIRELLYHDNRKIVRNCGDRRDQVFIARFLEIMWTMKTNIPTADTVSST